MIVGGLFAVLTLTNKDKPADQQSGSSSAQPTAHIRGKVDSKVNLTEYGDFECPACKAYFPLVDQIVEEYGDRVAFQFRHFPLTQIHANALIASRAAEAAGKQNKFFEFHDILYQQQDNWKTVSDPTSFFEGYATQLSLNIEQFKADLRSSEASDSINADRKVAQDLGSSSTPTFVLNGKRLETNPADLEGFKKLLDEALAQNQ